MKRPRTHFKTCWLLSLPLTVLNACSPSGTDVDLTKERTLDNCETSISSDAPDFFQNYRCATITTDSDTVTITTVDLPPHKSYYYGEDSENYTAFDGASGNTPNPSLITTQDFSVHIPLNPKSRGLTITGELVDGMAGTSQYEYHLPGVALDGVMLFFGTAAPGDDLNQASKAFEGYNGHPEDRGTYHYHGPSKGPLEVLVRAGLISSSTPGSGEVEIYGIMCDGTVVLGCLEADGASPASDRDAQGGHVHDIVDSSGATLFSGRYHTHVCAGSQSWAPEIQYYDTCNVTGDSAP